MDERRRYRRRSTPVSGEGVATATIIPPEPAFTDQFGRPLPPLGPKP